MDDPSQLRNGLRVVVRTTGSENVPVARPDDRDNRAPFVTGTLLAAVPNPYGRGRPEHDNHVWRVRLDTTPTRVAVFNYEEMEVFE